MSSKSRKKVIQTLAVNHRYFIRAPPQKVFTAISTSKGLTTWLANVARIEPHKGGKYALGWTDGPTHTGILLEFVPGKSIKFRWAWPGISLRSTVFGLSIASKDGGSILTVVHSGIPRLAKWVELYGGSEWGWTYFAMNLKSVLETGKDLRSKYDG